MTPSPRADAVTASATPLTAETLGDWPLPLDDDDDKRDRGTVLVIAGTERTPGAALLAGVAAMRAGAGRLQIATVEPCAAALGVAVPEAMILGLPSTAAGAPDPAGTIDLAADRIAGADAILLGPGFDDLEATRTLVAAVLSRAGPDAVMVVDALALVALPPAEARSATASLVLTPNREEARSLVPEEVGDVEDGEMAAHAARAHGATVTLSGHVSAPDGTRWVVDGAVPGLGTSGSGDVLAGLVAGAAARCGDGAQAACWGTYLHVGAGKRLAERLGDVGYLARELTDEVPRLMHEAMPSSDEERSVRPA
jgi:ADP-dependent NAD(P)H-hydrate dehydratase